MTGLILYQSKYGAAHRYAQWLAGKTGFPLFQTKNVEKSAFLSTDTIILMGGVYASQVSDINFLRKNREALKGKRSAVLAVGASPAEPEAIESVRKQNLKEDLAGIPFFYARGAWNLGQMSAPDRILCKLLLKSVAKKEPSKLEPLERVILALSPEPVDWTDPGYLEPVLHWLEKIEKE